ncbi:STAS domain-containing protein [Spironucleus salmonicida]|uniref:STAS domain-containing protein n=1 Tax=Spironucleus salmonicida TaxID=348837 RepID=V6LBL3_9EUKA|nr:STAS domain-containing protein [Spironucleus salmonicida]|eukprot:EST41855.1 STAS domain-containing protein [Spironucleus salmonicida]
MDLGLYPPFYQLQPQVLDRQLQFWVQRIQSHLVDTGTHFLSLKEFRPPLFHFQPEFDLVNRILCIFSDAGQLEKVDTTLFRVFVESPVVVIRRNLEVGLISSVDEIKEKLQQTQLREFVNENRFYELLEQGEAQKQWKCSRDKLGRVDGVKLG